MSSDKVKCKTCGKFFTVAFSRWLKGRGKYCSVACYRADVKLLTRSNDYIFLRRNKKYIPRARVIMEQKLGRSLEQEEIVHHINGIKTDDRPENLQLFANKKEHDRFHNLGKKRPKLIRSNSVECQCETCKKVFKICFSDWLRGRGIYCSRKCADIGRRK